MGQKESAKRMPKSPAPKIPHDSARFCAFSAKLDPEVRRGAKKKLTEAAVKSAVQRHPSYAKATEAYLQAKELAAKLRALAQAFRTRDFDLRELSARQRGERAGSRG